MKKLTQILTVVTGAFFIISSSAIAEDYVYKQKFMPKRNGRDRSGEKQLCSLRILKTISYQKKVLLGG